MRELARLVAALAASAILLRGFASGRAGVLVGVIGIAAALVVVNALVLWSEGAVTLGAAALATAYAGSLYLDDVAADPWVPAVAGLLVLYLEAADFASAVPPGIPIDRSLAVAALRRAGARAVLGAVAATVVVAVAAVPAAPSPWLRVLGMLGAAAAVAAPVSLLRRR